MTYFINVTDHDGKIHHLEATVGFSLMEIIRDAGLDIEAICGGCCACATCHIKIDESWISKIGKVKEGSFEGTLIEYEKGYDPNTSRLGCQIQLNKEHDGLVVHLLDNHKI